MTFWVPVKSCDIFLGSTEILKFLGKNFSNKCLKKLNVTPKKKSSETHKEVTFKSIISHPWSWAFEGPIPTANCQHFPQVCPGPYLLLTVHENYHDP